MRDGSAMNRSMRIVSAMTRPRFSQCSSAIASRSASRLLGKGDREIVERALVAFGVDTGASRRQQHAEKRVAKSSGKARTTRDDGAQQPHIPGGTADLCSRGVAAGMRLRKVGR